MLIALAVILCILLILFAALTLWLPSFVMNGKRQTLDEAMAWQSDHYDTSFYTQMDKKQYTVQSSDGYLIHAELLPNPASCGKYVILSHGYTDNRIGSLKYARMYLDLGFSCILYDLRGHGENEPTFTTYGLRESEDLKCLIEDTRARYPDVAVLGLHGESLGAATTLTALKDQPKVDFAVADCGFSDIENVLRNGYRQAHAPQLLFDIADLGARLRYHYSLKAMRPIDSLGSNRIPILFIHGAQDSFILPKNSEDMAQRNAGYSELRLISGAGHAESVLTAPEDYKAYLEGFLNRILPERF